MIKFSNKIENPIHIKLESHKLFMYLILRPSSL